MNDPPFLDELARLRARVATLEQLVDGREQTAPDSRAAKSHRDHAQILQLILDSMADGVVVVDENGKFLLFNPAAEQTLGIGALDTRPEDWTRDYGLYLPDEVTPFPPEQLPLARAMRGEAVTSAEVVVRRADKVQATWLSVNARPL